MRVTTIASPGTTRKKQAEKTSAATMTAATRMRLFRASHDFAGTAGVAGVAF
jgi:hypothetical protein